MPCAFFVHQWKTREICAPAPSENVMRHRVSENTLYSSSLSVLPVFSVGAFEVAFFRVNSSSERCTKIATFSVEIEVNTDSPAAGDPAFAASGAVVVELLPPLRLLMSSAVVVLSLEQSDVSGISSFASHSRGKPNSLQSLPWHSLRSTSSSRWYPLPYRFLMAIDDPRHRIFPLTIMPMREQEHSASASSIECVVRTTVWSAERAKIRFHSSRFAMASTPQEGSSR
mmetsp:Transcript_12936/g.31537  ORF Transcript_12936/g.31537 Transcript_12936/m.31537 type:complete len:227 (+) Transcript_12936:414-1094(+)